MAYTEPLTPAAATGTATPVTVSDYTDTHRVLHARHLTGGVENVRAHTGVVNGTADNTDAFVKAINNLKARTPLGGGKLVVPAGLYRVNGDAIWPLLTDVQGWEIVGDGQLSTAIAATAGATMGFGWNGAINCVVRGISFGGTAKGDGKDGFLSYGNSRSNMFDDCRFLNGTYGFRCLADPGAPLQDQNERYTFLNCAADQCTTGYRFNSNNSQGALFLGGGSSGCDTAWWSSTGWAEFHSWFAGSGSGVGTAWKTDAGHIQTSLYDCLDEGFAISFDYGNGYLTMVQTFLQGFTHNVKCAGAGRIDASYCHFLDGSGTGNAFTLGDNSVFWDRENTFAGTTTITAGNNVTRHKWDASGLYSIINSTIPGNAADFTLATPAILMNPAGYIDFHQTQVPASPAALYRRLFMQNGGALSIKTSGGVVTSLEV